jgi:hypothetical protein
MATRFEVSIVRSFLYMNGSEWFMIQPVTEPVTWREDAGEPLGKGNLEETCMAAQSAFESGGDRSSDGITPRSGWMDNAGPSPGIC